MIDSDAPLETEVQVDGERLPRDILDDGSVRWEWRLGFNAGEVEIGLRLRRHRVPYRVSLITDPDIRKMTRDDFTVMVQQILEDTFALLSLSSHRIHLERGSTSPAIARLEYLRTRLDELVRTVEAVNAHPMRVLRGSRRLASISEVHGLTGNDLARSLPGRHLVPTNVSNALALALGGRLPTHVEIEEPVHALDIREHRDMKSALNSWSEWLLAVADKLSATNDFDQQRTAQAQIWAYRCRTMARRIGALLRLPLFTEVLDVRQPLTVTAAYKRRPDYSRFLKLYREYQLGIANVMGDFLNLPLARTWELYELWAYLRLVRAATSMFGTEPDVSQLFAVSAREITVAAAATAVEFPGGLRLCFKRNYREFWLEADGRGSFSREMEPDIALESALAADRQKIIIFDAKYRIDEGLNAALASIHMYRDALVQAGEGSSHPRVVSGAYLVSPQVPVLPADQVWQQVTTPSRFFHPVYRSTFRFGAFTMQPGISDEGVADMLRTAIADAER